jgi:DNA-binding transcriptional LysR family regulator
VTTISDLDIFARVARTGNMSAAGREMGLSPAVVSKRISQLEERLGARLFQRTTRHLTLTETGAGYFRRVVDILSLCDEAEDFVSRRNTKPRGLLKVTMPTAFSRLHIAPYMGRFLARYPEIEIDVHISDAFVDIIRDGFDLAIRIGELEDSSLVARRIASDTRVVCAAPAYIERHGTPTDLVDLEAHNCLAADAAEVWRLEGPDGEAQFHPHGNARSDSGEFIRELVLAGVGIGLLSTWDIGQALRSGALRLVLPEYRAATSAAVHAVYPSREFVPAKVNVLIEFLAELYGSEPYWDKDLDLDKVARPAARQISRRVGKASPLAATR